MRTQTGDQVSTLEMKYCVILSKSLDLSELRRFAAWIPALVPLRMLKC